VSRELQAIGERFGGDRFPLLILHDVRWPHGRRDAYYVPEAIPADERHPITSGAIFPGEEGIAWGGLPYRDIAEKEGGPRNGVLTALEDFLEGRDGLRIAIVPAFYGVGFVWPGTADWSDAVASLLEPLDRNPWLERLEQHRVYNLARLHQQTMRLQSELHRLHAFNERKTEVLEQLKESRAFRLGDRIAHLRNRNGGSWREQLQNLIRER
jgi:hypothetical protein